MSKVATINLPDFGKETNRPDISATVYKNRLVLVRERMIVSGFDIMVVYGDREHFATLAWLIGFDPRFEEALLLLDIDGHCLLLVGNECMGYLPDTALNIETELFQAFSLPGQPRETSRSLRAIFDEFGIGKNKRIGCAGWKYFYTELVENHPHAIEIPAYIVDLLRDMSGGITNVVNVNSIFIDPVHGLRIHNEPEQIAFNEYASTVTSEGVLAFLRNLREGVAENELEHYLDSRGLPLTCHRMVSFGEKTRRGLSSASDNCAKLGDSFAVAFGVTGALTCRAGCIARGPSDIPEKSREFYQAFTRNYFDVVAAWYGNVRVGATGGDIYRQVNSIRNDALFDFAVNPGHYIHLDEWVHSPFSPDSEVALRSGMALQMDIIPVSNGPFHYVNTEDGVVLADKSLRDTLALRYPGMWNRIMARRTFMQEAIGIRLDESVLPLGNIPAWLTPYALDLTTALTMQNG